MTLERRVAKLERVPEKWIAYMADRVKALCTSEEVDALRVAITADLEGWELDEETKAVADRAWLKAAGPPDG